MRLHGSWRCRAGAAHRNELMSATFREAAAAYTSDFLLLFCVEVAALLHELELGEARAAVPLIAPDFEPFFQLEAPFVPRHFHCIQQRENDLPKKDGHQSIPTDRAALVGEIALRRSGRRC